MNANVRKAQDLASQVSMTSRRQKEEFAVWNSSISGKLDELRNKVMKARHIADGVKYICIATSNGHLHMADSLQNRGFFNLSRHQGPLDNRRLWKVVPLRTTARYNLMESLHFASSIGL